MTSKEPRLNDKNRNDKKEAPNRLMVGDASDCDDNSCVLLSVTKIKELGLVHRDSVVITKDNLLRSTVCIVLENETTDDGTIGMNGVIRNNLCVELGDMVSINPSGEISNGARIYVLPMIHGSLAERITCSLCETYVKPYFQNPYGLCDSDRLMRPVKKGDYFLVDGKYGPIRFKVIEVEVKDEPDQDVCIVAPETVILCDAEPTSWSSRCIVL
eukprot:47326_1